MHPVDETIQPAKSPFTASQRAVLDWYLDDLAEPGQKAITNLVYPPTAIPRDAAIPVLSADYDEPDCCDYTLNQGSCWVTVDDLSIYILRTDLGVCVDVCPRGQEADETIAALCAPFPEVD